MYNLYDTCHEYHDTRILYKYSLFEEVPPPPSAASLGVPGGRRGSVSVCFTLSMWGCQYSSCWVFAIVPLILEKKVGLVRYSSVGSKSNVSAITAWIRSRTFLMVTSNRRTKVRSKDRTIYDRQCRAFKCRCLLNCSSVRNNKVRNIVYCRQSTII